MRNIDPREIVRDISAAKKYRGIYGKTIERVVEAALVRHGGKEVEREARNLLHQVWGAYWGIRPSFPKLLRALAEDVTGGKSPKESVLPILSLHASTRERLAVLDTFYGRIFDVTGVPESIVDHACGLNPLTVFWMNLPKTARYVAFDIDIEEIDFLNAALGKLGMGSLVRAHPGDVLTDELPYAEVAFFLKLLPCLEHQEAGSGVATLRKQPCKFAVVSYPVKSIGGSAKGMVRYYERQFIALAERERWGYTTVAFDTELVFVIEKQPRLSA